MAGKALTWGLAAFGALATLAALYSLYWEFAAGQFQSGIRAWAAERGREGTQVGFSALRVDGYPFRLRAAIADPTMERRSGARPWSWRGPTMILTARPWRPGRLALTANGRHAATVLSGGAVAVYDIAAPNLGLKLRFSAGGLARARLSARQLAVRDSLGDLMRLAAAEVILRRPGAANAGSRPSLDVMAEVDALALRLEAIPGLSKTTAKSRLEASVKGPLPSALGRAALADWRDVGGIVEVRKLTLEHGTLSVAGDGTLALDADMQPIGAFTARVRGFNELIDQLSAAGVVKPRPAAMLKAALGVLAGEQRLGGAEIRVPLSVQERRLYVGPIAVLRFQALAWD
jgi:hypothetical protein